MASQPQLSTADTVGGEGSTYKVIEKAPGTTRTSSRREVDGRAVIGQQSGQNETIIHNRQTRLDVLSDPTGSASDEPPTRNAGERASAEWHVSAGRAIDDPVRLARAAAIIRAALARQRTTDGQRLSTVDRPVDVAV
jgi:hypothetical protein